jgi:4-amino-4-deoxy-L-arabinose transferase-like glycosyltransferase
VIARRHLLLGILCLAWIFPGLLAHDPWKPDEAYTFGIVYEMLQGGSWIAPALAGEPFVREPPLYYISAALSALALSPPLPLHDAARMATAFFMALALLFCALAGRELNGRGYGTLAAVLLIGCFGLVLRSHQLVPQVAGLTGFAMAYYGCARALRGPLGGIPLGTGIGIVFLSQGIPETLMMLLIAALLPLVNRAWRTREYAQAFVVAVIAALPWILVWPVMLHSHSPDLFRAWVEAETVTRVLRGGGFYYLRILPWYAWPVWPLALWSLWRAFGTSPVQPAIALPLTGLVITLLALTESVDKRELYAMPLLLPFTLLATPGIDTLRRGASNAWFWFSLMGFTVFVLVAWLYWSALELGVPAGLHAHLHEIQPGYTPGFRLLPFVIGALYTVGWFAVLFRFPRNGQRPAWVWASGVTLTWGLLGVLFISWVDVGKSYRGMVVELTGALPSKYRCVSSRELGEAQRAMLHYFGHIVTYREESPERRRDCDLMLVQGTLHGEAVPGPDWSKIWEGSRPGDRTERYRLYQRAPASPPDREKRTRGPR